MGQWGGFAITPHRMAGMPQILCFIATEGQGLSGRSGILATPVSCRSEALLGPATVLLFPVHVVVSLCMQSGKDMQYEHLHTASVWYAAYVTH